MLKNFIVLEHHMGGYYTVRQTDNLEDYTEECELCGDQDRYVGSYDNMADFFKKNQRRYGESELLSIMDYLIYLRDDMRINPGLYLWQKDSSHISAIEPDDLCWVYDRGVDKPHFMLNFLFTNNINDLDNYLHTEDTMREVLGDDIKMYTKVEPTEVFDFVERYYTLKWENEHE